MDIFKAVKTGDIVSVVEYIKSRGDNNIRDSYDMTPLIVAADEGRVEIVKLLLESNTDINAQDKIGQTALHLAAGRNDTEIIKLLIRAKAKLNLKAINGLTAYQYAVENGMKKAAILLNNSLDKKYGMVLKIY